MRGILLFDIDGVIRDVGGSYRLAIQKTVDFFAGYEPKLEEIDSLKSEGCWNNDWDASRELIRRYLKSNEKEIQLPSRKHLVEIFSNFYFGGNCDKNNSSWKGLIKNESLLVDKSFFNKLTKLNFKWGFVSGAELPSAKFVLETRLGLKNPPLITMEDAPEKPNPQGLIQIASQLSNTELGEIAPSIAYLGDTVADVYTIIKAREKLPKQNFISLAIAPPHLRVKGKEEDRFFYEKKLIEAGADKILQNINEIIYCI